MGSVTTYDVPTSLSPSRVESFTSCPLAFRFVNIEKIDDPPSVHTTRGSLVHRALELAFWCDPAERTPELFQATTAQAISEYREHPDFTRLGLSEAETATFDRECRQLVANYLRMEDPTSVQAIGVELMLSAQIGDLTLRGIIDRLELRDGELVVTDYKTGRAPSVNWEQRSLGGVHFYSLLCQEVFGRLPVAIRLMYLSSGETIETKPSERSARFIATRTAAVFEAVERACQTGDFRARPSALCGSCRFQPWCPSFGGNPDVAAVEAPVAFGLTAA
jgi:putative RecB family exonuclease